MNASTRAIAKRVMDVDMDMDMNMKNLQNTIIKKLKTINNANQSAKCGESRRFHKIYGNDWTLNEYRIYMESRTESIQHDGLMRQMTAIRSIYLTWLRSYSIKTIAIDNKLWKISYKKALNFKKDLLSILKNSNGYNDNNIYNDKDIRYTKQVISTLEKYIANYLERRTDVSVEILRAIRCKYIDRFIMGFI